MREQALRFFFFFPAPAWPLMASCDIDLFSVANSCDAGAGVADERIVVVMGVSGSLSTFWATEEAENDIFE
jgi:hypothetical protein